MLARDLSGDLNICGDKGLLPDSAQRRLVLAFASATCANAAIATIGSRLAVAALRSRCWSPGRGSERAAVRVEAISGDGLSREPFRRPSDR
jgi:hypothetical protein